MKSINSVQELVDELVCTACSGCLALLFLPCLQPTLSACVINETRNECTPSAAYGAAIHTKVASMPCRGPIHHTGSHHQAMW